MNKLNGSNKRAWFAPPPGIIEWNDENGSPPSAALGMVLKELRATGLADQTTQRMAEILARFTIYIEKGHGLRSVKEIAEEHVEGFVFASVIARADRSRRPGTATMHLRRSALRLYFRLLREMDLFVGDPTVDLGLPARSSLAVRPLIDDEIALCRCFSLRTLSETRQPAAWALAEATARTSEIPNIRVSDLDLAGGRVWIAGSTKTAARWASLTNWGRTQLERRVRGLKTGPDEDALVVYEGCGSEQSKQASSCIAISETLLRAGLAGEPDVRPASVAGWAGRRVFEETGRIDEVASRLGVRSLDRGARLIGWEWDRPAGEQTANRQELARREA